MSYFGKLSQNVIVSTLNSSTGNIGAGATFTGIGDSTLNCAGIQVSFYCDQNCTIYVEQSIDNIYWDISDTFKYYALSSFGTTVQATSSYARIRILNLNTVTPTSTFRLSTVFCPIVEAVPRALDSDGFFKTSINNMIDTYGFSIHNTAQGEMKTVIPVKLVGTIFDGNVVDSNFWSVTNVGTGTTTQSGSVLTMATGSTANSTTTMTSNRRARYMAGASLAYGAVLRTSTGVVNNKRRWGVAYGASLPATPTITDAALFQLDGTTLSVVTINTSTPNVISSGSFNGQWGKTYILDNNYHTFEIIWSGSRCIMIIDNIVLHSFASSNTPLSGTLSHYIFMDNVNSNGISSNNIMQCRTASIRRMGQVASQPTYKYQSGTTAGIICKYGPGNIHKAIISGVANNSVVTLYDGLSTGGTVLWSTGSQGTNTVPYNIHFDSLPFYTGLFFTITVSNSNLLLIYE